MTEMVPWRLVRIGLAAGCAVVLFACSSGGGECDVAASTQTTDTVETTVRTSTDATAPPPPSDPNRCSTQTSSPARFNEAGGQYAVYLTELDASKRTLSFDVIQFLGGADAVAAYHREVPDDPDGPPNDYFIVNGSTAIRTAPVPDDVTVRLVRLQEDGSADLSSGRFDELPGYLAAYAPDDGKRLSYNPFWITMYDGRITDLCEQYVP